MALALWLMAWSTLPVPLENDPCVGLSEAKAAIRAGDLPSAQLALETCVVALPRNAEAWRHLGLVHFAQRQFDPAAAALERSLELDGRQPQVYKMLGRVETARSKTALAERAFVEAARLDPEDAEARYLLGRLYQSDGRLAEAARSLKEALALDPKSVRALAFLGTVSYGLGDDALSQESFARAVSLNRASKTPERHPAPRIRHISPAHQPPGGECQRAQPGGAARPRERRGPLRAGAEPPPATAIEGGRRSPARGTLAECERPARALPPRQGLLRAG